MALMFSVCLIVLFCVRCLFTWFYYVLLLGLVTSVCLLIAFVCWLFKAGCYVCLTCVCVVLGVVAVYCVFVV